MATKKNRLDIEPFDDIHVIGIVSTMVDYKLACYIQDKFHFEITRFPDISFDDVHPFAFFYYTNGENRNAFNLVSLRFKDYHCLKQKPQVDYFFIVRNDIKQDHLDLLMKGLKETQGVSYAFYMDLDRRKDTAKLLEEIEMHEMVSLKNRN